MEKVKAMILKLLQDDAKLPIDSIAAAVGKPVAETEKLIKELETEGIIVKYSAIINTNKLTDDRVDALIEVKVTPQRTKGFDKLAQEIYCFDEVKSVYLMSGAYDLAVFIEGKSLKEVAMFVSEKLSTMDSVIGTATHFILKKYKQNGVCFEDVAEGKRLAINP